MALQTFRQRSVVLVKVYNKIIFLSLFWTLPEYVKAQDMLPAPTSQNQGWKMLISGTDTFYMADLQDVVISSPRLFRNQEEYKMYMRYKRYAANVYPYAKEAIEVYRQIKEETEDLKRGKRKKYIRSINKEIKGDYKETFKNMTRLQGKVMIKMIERELDISFFDLIKEVKGGFTATYWDTFSRLYGYKLKEKYQEGDEPILDAVLQDFDLKSRLK